jgi:serralysin
LAYAHPGLYDVAAIQSLYGPNTTTDSGDDVYRLAGGAPFQRIIWDAGGHDVLDASAFSHPSRIDLRPGAFSSIGQLSLEEARHWALDRMGLEGAQRAETDSELALLGNSLYHGRDNLTIAFGAVVEDAYGGIGDDVLLGNGVGNHLVGNAGNDQLDGGGGNDYLVGGTGDDHLERFPIRLNRAARIKAAYVADCLGGMCNLIGDCSRRR